MYPYYLSILGIGLANLALAAVAYGQRAKQIRGNALREQQVALAEARNDLAERRLRCLDEQLVILTQIRDALSPDPERQTTIDERTRLRSVSPSTSEPPAAA